MGCYFIIKIFSIKTESLINNVQFVFYIKNKNFFEKSHQKLLQHIGTECVIGILCMSQLN